MRRTRLQVLFVVLCLAALAVFRLRTQSSSWVGMSAQKVQLEVVHPLVLKQMPPYGRRFSRIASSSGAGLLEVWTDYYLWQGKPLFTRWETCTVDTNGLITKVKPDWHWKGWR